MSFFSKFKKNLSFLIILLIISACAANPEGEQTKNISDLSNYDVVIKSVPFKETVFGKEINDSYRWMEKKENQEELIDWMKGAGKHTYSQLESLPGRARVLKNLSNSMAGDVTIYNVNMHDGKLFYIWGDVDAENYTLYMRDELGEKRQVFNPLSVALEENDKATINNYTISPSGESLAVHVGLNGSEIGNIYFVNIKTGDISDYSIGPVWGEFSAAWLDENIVAVTKISNLVDGDPMQAMEVSLHDLNARSEQPLLGRQATPELNFELQDFPRVYSNSNSKWLFGFASGARRDSRVFLKNKNLTNNKWIDFAGFEDNLNNAVLIGDMLYLLTTKNASNGKILILDLSESQLLSDAKTLIEHDVNKVLKSISGTSNELYIKSSANGVDSLDYLKHGYSVVQNIKLPIVGGLSLSSSNKLDNAIVRLSSPKVNGEYFKLDGEKFTSLGLKQKSYAYQGDFDVVRVLATSADGAEVPLTIFKPNGANSDQPSPAHLYAYGGYGSTTSSNYRSYLFAWLEEGGVYANCHVRGGGAKGRSWYEDGKGAKKKNGHADFIACGEKLIELGYTKPEYLTAGGVSMGGVLVGPAILKRPDLFAAAYISVGVLNPVRLLEGQNGMNQVAELGDPRTEEGFKQIYDMDTYVFMQGATEVPDLIFPIGLNDQRVAPWATAKVVAYLNTNKPDTLALIRSSNNGHGGSSTNNDYAEQFADIYSFFLNRVGHPDFQIAE